MTGRAAVHFGPRLVGTPTGTLRTALLVKPAKSIENAQPRNGEPGAIYARSLEQHEILAATLQYFGVETIALQSRGPDPYESSVGDVSVALEDGAVMMRTTALARRGEVDRMEAEFSIIDVPLAGHIAAPGMLDGNDVLLAGETAFVGVGSRGNALGRDGFAQLARAHGYRVVEVKLAGDVPALRAVVGVLAHDTIVVGADKADAAAFEGFKTIVLERGEELAAGVLCLDDGHVLADIRFRTSLSAMRRAGVTVEAIDLYDFTKLGMTPAMLALALKRD
ncbi:MAG: hypothetical protein WA814_00745 [Candidatus Baltobacteraceae bacterium]